MSLALCLKRSAKKCKKGSAFVGVHRSSGKQQAYAATVYDKQKAWTVYLGTFDSELEAARAHDIATFKCSGNRARCNFPKSDYEKIWRLMENVSKKQVMTIIRRNGSRFSRTSHSSYRGVFRKHGDHRWAAHKQIEKETYYLGCFETAEEAAMAYDVEGIKLNGWNALTNFDISLYNVEAILASQKHLAFAEHKFSFVKKELLENPKNYTKAKGNRFLDEIEDHLQALVAGQLASGGPAQIMNEDHVELPAVDVSEEQIRAEKTLNLFDDVPEETIRAEKTLNLLDDVPEERIRAEKTLNLLDNTSAYHFHPEAGRRFQHSSSSCFHPYK